MFSNRLNGKSQFTLENCEVPKCLYVKRSLLLSAVLLGCILRIFYALDLPLSGDEAGVGLLQASGQALMFREKLPRQSCPIEQVREFISYSEDYSIADVLRSLRHAGMHPPLYYVMLHYVLKYIGNDALALRMISVIISMLSIVFIYQLGKSVYSEKAGILSALFLAISAYGVMYGPMVRPYPLAMLISLASTFQMYKLNKAGLVNFKNISVFLYIITVLAGLYTIYHFVFVFIFQIVFLVISNLRNKKSLLIIFVSVIIIAALYLPWLPSLFDQLKVVTKNEYYFHGGPNLLLLAEHIISYNFLRYLPVKAYSPVRFVLATIIYLVVLLGCFSSLKDKKNWPLIFALVVYVLVNFICDRVLNTKTLNVRHLLFFIIPASLVFLAIGLSSLTNRYCVRMISVLLCCCLLLYNSIGVCRNKTNYDGPKYIHVFRDHIHNHAQGRNGLIITNSTKRRHLFPLVHAIKDSLDMKIVNRNKIESGMVDIINKDYDSVFIMMSEFLLTPDDIENISHFLAKDNFDLTAVYQLDHDENSLVVFEKNR